MMRVVGLSLAGRLSSLKLTVYSVHHQPQTHVRKGPESPRLRPTSMWRKECTSHEQGFNGFWQVWRDAMTDGIDDRLKKLYLEAFERMAIDERKKNGSAAARSDETKRYQTGSKRGRRSEINEAK